MGEVLRWVLIGLLAVGLLVSGAFALEMNEHYARVRGTSDVMSSPYGEVEFTQGGSGPAVLVIHGSGGGFDQGEILVDSVIGDRFHWITPSRFGYLRSTFHEGATFDDQAHAYAYLLDHLGIDKVAVVALSHGAPSALLFAALHPDRVTSLALISGGVAPSVSEDQAEANQKGDMLTTIYKHDGLYWALTKLFRKQFLGLLGATPDVSAELTPEQWVLVDRVVDEMNPVSLRSAGVAFDNRAELPGERIGAIQAPTLIFHAQDDTLQLYHNAEFAAAHIPNARLVSFERGGHLALVTERAAIREALHKHIRENASGL